MPIITINGEKKEYAADTTFEAIAKSYQSQYKALIADVIFNGKIRELFKKVKKDGELSFVTVEDQIGYQTLVRTALMMLVKAVRDVTGEEASSKVKVEFSVGYGYYCSVKMDGPVPENLNELVEKRMDEMQDSAIPIFKSVYPLDEAIDIFKRQGMEDKVKLFHFRRNSEINMYNLDGYFDYFYGYMLPNTSYVRVFRVEKYRDGLLLVLPPRLNSNEIVEFAPREKLVDTMVMSTKWGQTMGIDNVGDLNSLVCGGNTHELILVQEAFQERRIGEIAKKIHDRKDIKFVMIAGPSSSGKTSFANRMSIQLQTYGLVPHLISLDNYFKNREDTPRDENGNYNFECLEAIDVEQFNVDMKKLLAGEQVELPIFNFITGKREDKGIPMKLNDEDVLVIEGIHGLNEKMSYALPAESKFKIYISALTSINIDNHNRIPTTDGRLLRRIVRDARTRGTNAAKTIAMWPSVRAGEEQYIFPFQESADEMFNSVQIYELSIIKQYAEPLLFSIPKDAPEYLEAKRLLKFLEYFVGMNADDLPRNSICREFVGGSCFNV
ncbi:MAG: nucleoside kinase [Butyrivibrio sp.]|nr:nucleoside kinase [Butyrivibrio sp.]